MGHAIVAKRTIWLTVGAETDDHQLPVAIETDDQDATAEREHPRWVIRQRVDRGNCDHPAVSEALDEPALSGHAREHEGSWFAVREATNEDRAMRPGRQQGTLAARPRGVEVFGSPLPDGQPSDSVLAELGGQMPGRRLSQRPGQSSRQCCQQGDERSSGTDTTTTSAKPLHDQSPLIASCAEES